MVFIDSIWKTLCELSPWLLLGMALSGLLHVIVPPGWVRRQFRGMSGVFKSVAIGVPLPLCSCGVVPAAVGLKKDGASDGAAVGFLISTPQTGVDSILVSGSFFGWPFACFKVAAALVTGVVGGLLVERRQRDSKPLRQKKGNSNGPQETHDSRSRLAALPVLSSPPEDPTNSTAADCSHSDSDIKRPWPQRWWSHSLDVLRSIWGWLLIGIVIAAAVEALELKQYVSVANQYGLWLAMLSVLVVSVPIYVCTTASVPIAAAMVTAGLPPAVALVFLMAGPATNVTTIGAIRKNFGTRSLAIYLLTIIAGSMVSATIFDWTIQVSSFADGHDHLHSHHATWWAQASAVVVAVLLIGFAISDGRRLVGRWWVGQSEPDLVVAVEGMTCQNCVRKLESKLIEIAGVQSAVVSLANSTANVVGDVTFETVADAVRACGFTTAADNQELKK